jgi:3-hydroxyisobutyrate dehydrogenase-like beta-hydroxyacid dehydrogenase
MKVGVIGLGRMGSGLAASLLEAGHEVTVYNRTRARAEPLLAQGAKSVDVVAGACRGEAVLTMLSDDAALQHVAFGDGGIIASLGRRSLHICSSTISVAMSRQLAAAHASRGQRFIAAPVLGRPDMAATGRLFVFASGEASAVDTAKPLLDTIGQRTFVVSHEPQVANAVKLSCNFLIASVIESLGEAMSFVHKNGVDRHDYLAMLTATLFDAPIYATYGEQIASRTYSPAGFAAPLGLKDIRILLQAADDLRVPLPLASLLRDRFLTLLAHGGEMLDWSAIGSLAARDASADILDPDYPCGR